MKQLQQLIVVIACLLSFIKVSAQTSLEDIIANAEKGDVKSQCTLGYWYETGNGVEQDYSKAFQWYKKAADQDYLVAQFCLGRLYAMGAGVDQDYSQAFSWYHKAAEQGLPDAQYTTALFYQNGYGIQQDYSQAFEWYKKAAQGGYVSALTNIGYCYQHGLGVEQNYEESLRWYYKAASEGELTAQYNLGGCFEDGRGVTKDYKTAFEWFLLAAEKGLAEAQTKIGYYYSNGLGVERDVDKAATWYRMAAKQGDELAINNLRILIENNNLPLDDMVSEQQRQMYNLGEGVAVGVRDDDDDIILDSSNMIYSTVNQPPAFPGGVNALMSWLSHNINYPTEAQKKHIQGRVLVTFVIEPDGSINNIKVTNGVDPLLDNEAIRVCKIMPKWIPGKTENGETVRVKYNLPITFKL